MIGICEQALSADCGTDTFVIYQMQALIAMGRPEQAVPCRFLRRPLFSQKTAFRPFGAQKSRREPENNPEEIKVKKYG